MDHHTEYWNMAQEIVNLARTKDTRRNNKDLFKIFKWKTIGEDLWTEQ